MPIRVADLADAAAIKTVINAAFRKARREANYLVDQDRIDLPAVQDLFGTGTFLVAEQNQAVIGCVHVEVKDQRSYLSLLSVDPDGQGSGLGSKLMTAAEDYCAKAGSRFMDLQIVNLRKDLPGFYHRRGYVQAGTAPFTLPPDPAMPCHFVNMSKPLK